MSSAITISYDLHPPTGVAAPSGLSTTKAQEFAVKPSEGQKAYYEALQVALKQAKEAIGEDLTAWRDAVGSGERDKEGKKPPKEDEDDEEEEELEEEV
ncbi:hypothetical protein PLICRDRAFT_35339 [Plicaturopsis crispa FD-325 SS-3]|nr:hypothetical protein PLICRDRAFT_35339 [Plicaturopsis crispa FD-325 SS-3]